MISSMSRAKRSTKTAARWLCRWGTASGLLPKGMGMEITGMIRPNSISPCWSQGAGIGMGRGWEWGWRGDGNGDGDGDIPVLPRSATHSSSSPSSSTACMAVGL